MSLARQNRKNQFTFAATLSAADQPVTVSFRTADGTATAGGAYVGRTNTITFAPGETTKTIAIEVKGDTTATGPAAGSRVAAPICPRRRVVQHPHQKGVIHRDLKPSNVLVTLHDERPVPKVIDFSVKAMGQQLTDRMLFTNFAHVVGTRLCMSPEQGSRAGWTWHQGGRLRLGGTPATKGDESTPATWLKDVGYNTARVGKDPGGYRIVSVRVASSGGTCSGRSCGYFETARYFRFATSTAYTCVGPCMLERNTTHLLSGVMVTFGSSR